MLNSDDRLIILYFLSSSAIFVIPRVWDAITPYTGRPCQSLFISAAAKPAPKPLSIFTTVTPAAQEFSIASNADRPWKLAP